MGKIRRQRQKLHIPSKDLESQKKEDSSTVNTGPFLPLTTPKQNLFSGLDIDLGNIQNNFSTTDDMQSVKSYKSIKSESGQKMIPKKDKIKLRRKLLLHKIDTINQMKKDLKLRKKRKNIAVIGDTNPLHDALPSLESLLKSRSAIKCSTLRQSTTKKGITKASRRKKTFVEGVKSFKQTLNHANLKKNTFDAISNHIRAVVQQELSLVKRKT